MKIDAISVDDYFDKIPDVNKIKAIINVIFLMVLKNVWAMECLVGWCLILFILRVIMLNYEHLLDYIIWEYTPIGGQKNMLACKTS